jgi:hypothetical protein
MNAAIPVIKVTNDANPLSIRRPDGETYSLDTIKRAEVRAKLVINTEFVSLREQINVGFAEGREERERIAKLAGSTFGISDPQIIGIDRLGIVSDAFKEAGRVNLREFNARFVFLVDRGDLDGISAWLEGANNHPGAIAERMHAKELVR